jgi:CheY-like chemotaxis protein
MSAERRTILVADDEASIRKLIVKALAAKGFDTIEAQNGLEAVQLYGTHRGIDLVITDVQMPVMDGLEALERMQAIDPEVRVIVVSGGGGTPVPTVRRWIPKPFAVRELVDSVVQALNGAR